MSKKKIILYIVLGIIAWNAILLPAYFLMNNHIKRVDYRGFANECYEYVKTDEKFALEYGSPVDFSYSDSQKIQKVKTDDGAVELVIDFYVKVESGETYYLKIASTYENEKIEYRYLEITKGAA